MNKSTDVTFSNSGPQRDSCPHGIKINPRGGEEVRRAILQRGLDPALGFLHAPQSGRESLALDILEPLRPEVDLFVLTLLDSSLNLKHFTTNDQDGCLLNKKGRSAFFKAWAKWQEPSGEDEKNIRSMAENFVRDLIAFFPDPDFYHS